MTLTPGNKLGPYEIQSPLGAGGMGEVYRARDMRLDRTVAIKVLVSHLASSPELKQRMEREARTISSLNHPHICHLYDIGSQDGTDYLVMELLEGETLAQRLTRGAIPLSEIFKIGMHVAEALAVAHRQGIVHRDLKPGNIMLTPAGAKLMDFGLAKPIGTQSAGASVSGAPSFTAAATMSGPSPMSPLTTAGSMVGTFQYMSPEQIEGKEADARSDIFAFGAVLYEMATGKRPFEGKSQISLASAILEKDPEPISVVKPLTPPAFENLVATCLRKSPEERFQSAHDIQLQLQWVASDRTSGVVPVVVAHRSSRKPLWAAGIAVALLLGAAAGFFLRPSDAMVPSIRTAILPPANMTFRMNGDAAGPPVLSPDGTMVAFTASGADGKPALYVRPLNSSDAHALPETDDAIFPFWSPDSRALGFFANGKLKTVEANGGAAQAVCEAVVGRGGAWSSDGTIIFSGTPQSPMWRVPATGGTPLQITTVDAALHTSHRWPFMLPDGKHFLYLAMHHDSSKAANDAVYFASLDGKENRLVLHSQANAFYADGFLLFARGDALLAQPFDPDKGVLSGQPQPIATGVVNDLATWHISASASRDGMLVFGTGTAGEVQLLWLDRTGKTIGTVADKVTGLQMARVSPQGDRVALQIDAGMNDIWVQDLARGVRTRLTFGPVANINPVWSPDGKWIAYSSRRDGGKFVLYRKLADGSGSEEALLQVPETFVNASDWTRDGKLLYFTGPLGGPFQLWELPLQGDRKPKLLLQSGAAGHVSPDGRWLAYASNESGTSEIYVVPFDGGPGKWQVSANGGIMPRWSHDGKQLYFMDRAYTIFTVPVKDAGATLQFGAAQPLAGNTFAAQAFFDVSPDGNKILLERVTQQINQSITVVTNFTAGLKK